MAAGRPDLPDRRLLGAAALNALALLGTSPAARAEQFIGQFELKTLDSAPRSFEFQSQNAWSWGEPARRSARGPDGIQFDENAAIRARHALELEMGFTTRLKMRVGIEFEKERYDEPETLPQAGDFDDLRLTEIGAEVVAVLVPRQADGAGLGIVAEIEGPTDQEGSNNLSLGPIFEFKSGQWFAAAVPTLVYAFGGDVEPGEQVDDKWDFAYAAKFERVFNDRWSLALEAYGTVDRLGDTGHPSASAQLFGDFNQHRAGPVLYYTHPFGGSRRAGTAVPKEALSFVGAEPEEGASLAIGVGVLEGLNGNTADHTLKLSIEVDF